VAQDHVQPEDALQHFRDEKQKNGCSRPARYVFCNRVRLKKVYRCGSWRRSTRELPRSEVWLGLNTRSTAKEMADFIQETVSIARDWTKRYGSISASPTLLDTENPITKNRWKKELYE